MIEGVDVSRAQPPDRCDWIEAAAAGLRFAFVKLTEGADYEDPAADEHLAAIRTTRIAVGVYHFGRPDNRMDETDNGREAGATEAAWFARRALELDAIRGSLPPVLDLEKYTTGEGHTVEWRKAWRADYVRGFLDEVERLTGRLPIVYTGPTYWGYQQTPDFALELRARGVLLWLAKYGRGVDPSSEIAGWPWSIWQWSGGGDVAYAEPWPGLPHPIDRNRYRGTEAEFAGLVRR